MIPSRREITRAGAWSVPAVALAVSPAGASTSSRCSEVVGVYPNSLGPGSPVDYELEVAPTTTVDQPVNFTLTRPGAGEVVSASGTIFAGQTYPLIETNNLTPPALGDIATITDAGGAAALCQSYCFEFVPDPRDPRNYYFQSIVCPL